MIGDPDMPDWYWGGRTYEEMSAFAKPYLSKPNCNAFTLEYCTDEQKKVLETLNKKTYEELIELFKESKEKIKNINQHYEIEVQILEAQFEEAGGEDIEEDDPRFAESIEPLLKAFEESEQKLRDSVEDINESHLKYVNKLIVEHRKLMPEEEWAKEEEKEAEAEEEAAEDSPWNEDEL
jgi:hypothetical protein